MMMSYIVNHRRPIVVAIQIALIVLANYSAFLLRFDGSIDRANLHLFYQMLPWLVLIRVTMFAFFRLHQGLWRYAGIWDLSKIFQGCFTSTIVFVITARELLRIEHYPVSIYFLDPVLLLLLMGGVRLGRRLYHELSYFERGKRVLLFGAGDAGEMIVRDMKHNPYYGYEPVGFVDDDPRKVGQRVHGVPVLGSGRNLPAIIAQHAPDEILVAIGRAEPQVLRAIVRSLEPYRIPIRTIPNLRDLISGNVSVDQIRKISLEDLLQRGPVGLDAGPLRRLVEGRCVLITGAGGSIGSELCRQLSDLDAGRLILFERYENALYAIEGDLHSRGTKSAIVPRIGDVTDATRVRAVFDEYHPEIILHAAAHKHVPLVEQNPCEAVKNNIRGTRIVAQIAAGYGAERFILISTDKAVNPSSVMGATKRAAEQVVKYLSLRGTTCFAIVRFGNVLGSNGSVVPKFLDQIRAGGPVTVTHPEMKRFFMTIPEAVNLVLHAATLNATGAIYALDMGTPVRIVDMARHLIRLSGFIPDDDIQIQFTGLRPGEKLYEQMVDDTEKAEPSEIRQIFRVICPFSQPSEQHYRELLRVEVLAVRGEHVEVVTSLGRLVPGFQPHLHRQPYEDLPHRAAVAVS